MATMLKRRIRKSSFKRCRCDVDGACQVVVPLSPLLKRTTSWDRFGWWWWCWEWGVGGVGTDAVDTLIVYAVVVVLSMFRERTSLGYVEVASDDVDYSDDAEKERELEEMFWYVNSVLWCCCCHFCSGGPAETCACNDEKLKLGILGGEVGGRVDCRGGGWGWRVVVIWSKSISLKMYAVYRVREVRRLWFILVITFVRDSRSGFFLAVCRLLFYETRWASPLYGAGAFWVSMCLFHWSLIPLFSLYIFISSFTKKKKNPILGTCCCRDWLSVTVSWM